MTRRKSPKEQLAELVLAKTPNLEEVSLVVWNCAGCAFTMDAIHMDGDGSGWTCPICSWHQSVTDAYGYELVEAYGYELVEVESDPPEFAAALAAADAEAGE